MANLLPKYDALLDDIRESDRQFITDGTNGIKYIRWESPDDGSLWDTYIDATGHFVTAAVSVATPTTGNPIGLLLTLTYA